MGLVGVGGIYLLDGAACSADDERHDEQQQRGHHAEYLHPTEKTDRSVGALAFLGILFDLQENRVDASAVAALFRNQLLKQDFRVIGNRFLGGRVVFFFHSRLGLGVGGCTGER